MSKPSSPGARADVAVVLCTYNGSRYLETQLTSILQQSVLPGEIRVYDDGSTDGTVELVRSVWRSRPGEASDVRLFISPPSKRRFGASENFARALKDTPQSLIALSDQDDEWLPERLAVALSELDARPDLQLVASNAAMMDENGEDVGRSVFESQRLTHQEHAALVAEDALPALLRRNLFPGMTFTLRRELFDVAYPIPAGAMHDYWLVVVAAATGRLHVSSECLVRYRIHAANAVGLDAGNRTLVRRLRIRIEGFRDALTDLPQWTALPDRLRGLVSTDVLARLEGKRDFELRRRFTRGGGPARVVEALTLWRDHAYFIYDFRGRRQVLRDALRHRDPFAASLPQARNQ